jgi:hypothetical protein
MLISMYWTQMVLDTSWWMLYVHSQLLHGLAWTDRVRTLCWQSSWSDDVPHGAQENTQCMNPQRRWWAVGHAQSFLMFSSGKRPHHSVRNLEVWNWCWTPGTSWVKGSGVRWVIISSASNPQKLLQSTSIICWIRVRAWEPKCWPGCPWWLGTHPHRWSL